LEDQTGKMRNAVLEDYDLLVNSCKWGAKLPDQEKIIALKAQVKELKDLKLSAQLMNKLKQCQRGKDQQNQQNRNKGGNNQGQNQGGTWRQNQKDKSNKRFQKQDEEWTKVPPKLCQGQRTEEKRVGIKILNWCIHHMKWTLHKPDNCDIGRKQQAGNQGNNNNSQNNRPHNMANQATYTELLAQLALRSADEWQCALAWLAYGFLVMTEPTTVTLIQAIFLLTFPFGLFILFTSVWKFQKNWEREHLSSLKSKKDPEK